MSDWKAKRFWKEARVNEAEDGFEVLLDGRSVRTPAKAKLVVPTREMSEAIAIEWDEQVDEIDPLTMPVTRGANAAIDKVAIQFDEVVDIVAAYGESDLLCYRASEPEGLVARQVEGWDPILEWCKTELDAPLFVAEGVMHIAQPARSISNLKKAVSGMSNFQLAGLYDLVSISGSLVLALALVRGRIDVEQAWSLSRIDESWQIEQWGPDDEEIEVSDRKQSAFGNANRFYNIS